MLFIMIVIRLNSIGHLFCNFLPTDGCVEWEYDDTKKTYGKKLIGTPKKSVFHRWISRMKLQDLGLRSFEDIVKNFVG